MYSSGKSKIYDIEEGHFGKHYSGQKNFTLFGTQMALEVVTSGDSWRVQIEDSFSYLFLRGRKELCIPLR